MTHKTMTLRLLTFMLLACLLSATDSPAQQTDPTVTVRTDRPDAVYRQGEKVVFLISVTEDGNPVTEGEVTVTLTRDMTERIVRQTFPLGKDPVTVTGTLKQPGFLDCEVALEREGKVIKTRAAAGFDPTRIQPACQEPKDFDAFWKAGRDELAKTPLDVKLTPLPEHSDAQQDAFKISFANIEGTRIYGFLNVPKGRKPPYPVWVHVPWSGVLTPRGPRPWYARRGALYLDLSIHDLDPMNPPPEEVKRLSSYNAMGAPDRNKYYFRRAILGLDRALDYLASREDFDGKHLVVTGDSQGGGLALILAGLNRNVTAISASVPALCDQKASLVGRSGTWPRLCGDWRQPRDQWAVMSEYFDAVNFARKIKCPTLVDVGFIDTTCPPGAVYAAYNVITAPKRIFNGPLSGHQGGSKTTPGLSEFQTRWIDGQLGLGPVVPLQKQRK